MLIDNEHMADLQAEKYEFIDNLHIWWFPKDFCQNGYGEFSEYGCSSCTLIALAFAERRSKIKGFSQSESQLPKLTLILLGNAIDDGNHAYKDKDLDITVFTVPQGILTLRLHSKIDFHVDEWFFTHLFTDNQTNLYIANDIANIIHTTVGCYQESEYWKSYPQLFVAITADNRCVMLAIDLCTSIIALFDSHGHDHYGAVYSQTTLYYLASLLKWYINMLDSKFSSHPPIFEVSFISRMPNVSIHIPPVFDPEANRLC